MSTGTRLGAHVVEGGTEFAVFSSVATAVDLVFEGRFVAMEPQEGSVWTAFVPDVGHGVQYGFRVHGPGRCNPRKLLLDPYAREIAGAVTWDPAVLDPGMDSAPFVPRAVVHDAPFDWGEDAHPGIALADSVIYELHVKGFTKLHPGVPEADRGTFRGLASDAAIEHLTTLGVTAVELLPVHTFVHDQALVARGLRNYWGYQSIGFFAPHNEYGSVEEFKAMVRALHAAGLEVILDVVFNHTAEGGPGGPTLCFRGLDDAAYYRLDANGGYVDDTGCGNTVDTHRSAALRLVMDSLRYWRGEMHVDGFRFDLAAALGRGAADFDPHAAFLEAVGQDPVLDGVKLIAEPWDTGAGGYEVGDFPVGWSEWNGRYRDTVRDLWRGAEGNLPDFATRIAGSWDLYGDDGRRPTASVNLITVHDGFTLADLVSYDGKHNEANGEDNRDGTDDNRSWNCGAEGPTDDPAILALRNQQQRNLLATLLLSQGVPLLLAGDELGHTQGGNNNAYCQDDETSWLAWPEDPPLVEFVANLIRLRRANPVFRRRQTLASAQDDLLWYRPDGGEMTGADWDVGYARSVAMRLEDVLLCVNGWWEPLTFTLPAGDWEILVSTAGDALAGALSGRSLMLLRDGRQPNP